MIRALLTHVSRLLALELDVAPLDAAVQAFMTQCDQAVAQDAATQAYVRQLEQAYDATGDAAPRPQRDDAFNPEQLMHDLEDLLAPGAGKRHRVIPPRQRRHEPACPTHQANPPGQSLSEKWSAW